MTSTLLIYREICYSVSYHLTDMGKNFIGTMGELFDWGREHMAYEKEKK